MAASSLVRLVVVVILILIALALSSGIAWGSFDRSGQDGPELSIQSVQGPQWLSEHGGE